MASAVATGAVVSTEPSAAANSEPIPSPPNGGMAGAAHAVPTFIVRKRLLMMPIRWASTRPICGGLRPEKPERDETRLIWFGKGGSPLPLGEVDLRSKSGEGLHSIVTCRAPSPGATRRTLPGGER